MRSSYIENNFGEILRQNVICWRPTNIVELGVLDGYSTLWIAKGIQDLKILYGMQVKVDAYDLFEDYPYKHGTSEGVQKVINDAGLTQYVNLVQGDAYKVWENYPDRFIDFLHVDISNTGDTVKKIMELWHPKMRQRGLIFFEGGSEDRDHVDWMVKYNLPGIKKEIDTNPIIQKYYIYGTYFKFPAMTMLLRRWGGEFDN